MLVAYPMQRMTLGQNEKLVQVLEASYRVWSVKHLDGGSLFVEYQTVNNNRTVLIEIDRSGEIENLTVLWPEI